LLAQYGFAVNPESTLLMRYLGVQFVLEGLLAWFARNMADAGARRAIFLAFFIAAAIGAIVSLLGTISGTLNALGWLSVGLDALFVLGFGYFLLVKRSAA
jgi:hypothetical protein